MKMCQTYNFYSIFIRFGDPENMRLDTKIVFLSGLRGKTSPKTQFNDCFVAILFFASKTFLKDAKLASALFSLRNGPK